MTRFLLRRMILRQHIPLPITICILNPDTVVGTAKGKLDDFCPSGLEEHMKVVTAVSRRWLYFLDSFLVIINTISTIIGGHLTLPRGGWNKLELPTNSLML